MSRLVDALVDRGDVQRSPDPADRRSWLVSLTTSGETRATSLLERAVAERRLVFDGFDEAELSAIITALERIDDNVRRLLRRPTAETPPG